MDFYISDRIHAKIYPSNSIFIKMAQVELPLHMKVFTKKFHKRWRISSSVEQYQLLRKDCAMELELKQNLHAQLNFGKGKCECPSSNIQNNVKIFFYNQVQPAGKAW
jgi:hypothetical protein